MKIQSNTRQRQLFEAPVEAEPAWSEQRLLGAALALGARRVEGWSAQEEALARESLPVEQSVVDALTEAVRGGADPLGDLFSRLRTPEQRRPLGATYTPAPIIDAMLAWALTRPLADRIVDPGVGSARYLMRAAEAFPKAELVGVEVDPLAAAIARANLAARGLVGRSKVLLQDYRVGIPATLGRTLFIGNPPYVRHHQIDATWKRWLTEQAAALGLQASQLAGLHVHFFLSTVLHAQPGDQGALITAAEWLDVNYGKLVRDLFLSLLGGQSVIVVEPTAAPFPDAATTAAITCFSIASRPAAVHLRRVKSLEDLSNLSGGQPIHRDRLATETRWSRLTHGPTERPAGYIELGELCRVHRGQVTGANRVWVTGEQSGLPASVLFRSVTRAKELISAGPVLNDACHLRSVIDLPEDLDEFAGEDKKAIERFLKLARQGGAHAGYIASHRRAWWSVGLRRPAPILATYMARRPPVFTRNLAEARHLNIAHGLYPREPLDEAVLAGLVNFLGANISTRDGRTYAGGLTKFEPGEMERLLVPEPGALKAMQGARA